MSTEEERVRKIKDFMTKGQNIGETMKYDPKSRRFKVFSDKEDPDNEMVMSPEDFNLYQNF